MANVPMRDGGREGKANLDVSIHDTGGHPEYVKLLEERLALHIEKSSGYGTEADPFANFTAVATLTGQPRYLYPVLRALEKLTRVLSLHAQGRTGELEEEFVDVASLLDCATAMLREDSPSARGSRPSP